MPIYEYECDSCDFTFEKRQSFNDEPVRTCPCCEGIAHRVFHPAPIIFKGSGFYITDSRKNSDNGGDVESGDGENKLPEKSSVKEESKEG